MVDYTLFPRSRIEVKLFIFFLHAEIKAKVIRTVLGFSLSVLLNLVCLLKLFQIKGVMKTGRWTESKV